MSKKFSDRKPLYEPPKPDEVVTLKAGEAYVPDPPLKRPPEEKIIRCEFQGKCPLHYQGQEQMCQFPHYLNNKIHGLAQDKTFPCGRSKKNPF